MTFPAVVSDTEWQAARDGLRVKEKAATRALDTSSRGVDRLRFDFNLLDLTPFGRQEEWEDSPEGWPQTPAYTWWRKHDEYEEVSR
jgi:predicted dithiol-disulfide oxidoreductase (DUF899 family)